MVSHYKGPKKAVFLPKVIRAFWGFHPYAKLVLLKSGQVMMVFNIKNMNIINLFF